MIAKKRIFQMDFIANLLQKTKKRNFFFLFFSVKMKSRRRVEGEKKNTVLQRIYCWHLEDDKMKRRKNKQKLMQERLP